MPDKTDTFGRSPTDIFFGHVSHNKLGSEVFCFTKFLYGVEKPDLILQGGAIEALAIFEEKFHEEEVLAIENNRKPRHPSPIKDLKKYAKKFLSDQDSFTSGMTYTSFVNQKGKYISVGFVKSLDEVVGEDGDFTLHDLVAETSQHEIKDWRKQEFCSAFEDMFNILSLSTQDIAALFCISERHFNNWIRHNIKNFQRIYSNCEVDEDLRGKMVESLFLEFKAALAAQNNKNKQGDLFVGEVI